MIHKLLQEERIQSATRRALTLELFGTQAHPPQLAPISKVPQSVRKLMQKTEKLSPFLLKNEKHNYNLKIDSSKMNGKTSAECNIKLSRIIFFFMQIHM